ncbi:MAG: hypothetical protein SH819_08060 [Cytophagales bacterium]|nr:hypothetical protein [Cytophagales bacterium]
MAIHQVRYRISADEVYTFRYNDERGHASVTYPNGTSSESQEKVVKSIHDFHSYVTSTLGEELIENTLSVFEYLFELHIGNGLKEFTIDAAILISACMTDEEKKSYWDSAIRLAAKYKELTGLNLILDEFQRVVIGRYRPRAEAILYSFQQLVNASQK